MRSVLHFKSHAAGLVVCLLLCGWQSAAAQAKKIDGDQLLDPERLIEIRIELAARDWSLLCSQSPNGSAMFGGLPSESSYTYFKADIWIEGQKIESVGVRKKGSFGSADFQRPSLKVEFDEYVQQIPVKGLSQLTLNNNKQDQSQVSQLLTYKLFRDAGNPAPRCNLAHVTVNGTSLGIYSNVESIKKSFLKRFFEDKSGNLYEGSLTDFHPGSLDYLEMKTNEVENDRADIRRLAELLAADGALDLGELEKIIDLDSFFRHWALEAMTGFWDGYASNQNNYFLYFNPADGRGYFIPWGADYAFTSQGPMSFGQGVPAIYAQGILANRLYHTKGVPERYQATMRRLLDEVWNEKEMIAEVDRVEELITPHLHQSQSGTPKAMDELREFINTRGATLQTALEAWRPFVPRRPRTPTHIVPIGNANGTFSTVWSEGKPDPADGGEADITVELNNELLVLNQLQVRVQALRIARFGGGGFGGFGAPGGGFGGPGGPPAAAQYTDSPVSLVFTGTRTTDDQPVTMSLTIARESFGQDSEDPIRVTGSLTEGRGGGGGFGFGGPAGGPKRYLTGHVQLAKSGTKAGDAVAGQIDLKIVETRGGIFSGNQGGNRGRGNRGGGPGFAPRPTRVPAPSRGPKD
ncbi:MAG: CotH kinase family protein [Pirellulales bacterium]